MGRSRWKQDAGTAAAALALLLAGAAVLWLISRVHAPEPSPAVEADATQDDEYQSGQKLIAITFDDGPKASTTTRLLDGLSQRGVKATFFLIGAQIGENEDLVRRMAAEGHQIGIHTYDHVKLTGLSKTDFDGQVDRTRQILKSLLGYDDFLLRPPYGMTDEGVTAHAGAPIILWSIDPEDWGDRNVQREYELIVSEARDGAIILMHDIFEESVDAALRVIDQLHSQGYLFVTIDELFASKGIPLEDGMVYWNACE